MGELSSPAKVKEILSRHNFHTKKSLGQNFLIDGNIINKIINTAEITEQDMAVEIGPGIGVLTSSIAQKAQKVLAVEIDNKLRPVLAETLEPYNNAKVVFADAMDTNFDQLVYDNSGGKFGADVGKYKLVANLPYYITTPIIMHLLTNKFNLHSLVVMVQKEVGMRMAASPGTKVYGSLSVAVQYYTEAEVAFKVPKTVFYPKPDVDSVIVRLKVRDKPPVQVSDEELYFKVVRAAFNQRRKTLLNALSGSNIALDKEQWINILQSVNIDPKRRGETLDLKEFALIADNINKYY
ncbi:MAG: 16S rRNA (adenine(1518)-N(6)/adenine(1519)-N(6))-dimethyltransferase RsmA [Firmicutes bacterium]|nr:16S rRNA (adenine(1518)-N(6)/adenine(1519)-N(6))-dimethyltransferase RsmA [Bacillota bacterium]